MKRGLRRKYFVHLCAAVAMAGLAAPSTALELVGTRHSNASEAGRTPTRPATVAGQHSVAKSPAEAPKTGLPGVTQDDGCPPAESSPLFRRVLCWWRDGLVRQSVALIP